MKPWHPYRKALNTLRNELLNDAGPAPFSLKTLNQWMSNLRFPDVANTDFHCFGIARDLADEIPLPSMKRHHNNTRWQLILRCQCALDFCRGLVEKRKDFDWDQNSEAVFKYLLFELWHQSAFHWCHVMYGSSQRSASPRSRLPREFWLRVGGSSPERN